MNRHLSLCCLLLWAAAAQAETSPWYVGLSQALSHNSNLLRLPEGIEPLGGLSRSDTYWSTSLLAGIDQPFGRQRAYGNVALRSNRFDNNKIYDNESYSATAGLDWSAADRLSGSVKAVGSRNLASFNNDQVGVLQKKNFETTNQLDTSWRLGVVTEYTLQADLGWRSLDYSAEEYQGREFRQRSAALGLYWRPSSAATFGAAWRDTVGVYPFFYRFPGVPVANDRFTRNDLDLTANLEPSGASTVFLRVSLSKAEYDVAQQNDFSTVTGQLRWNWRPSGKLRFDTRLSRDPSQDLYFDGGGGPRGTVDFSRLTTALRVRADYDVSGKIGLNAAWGHGQRSVVRTENTFFGTNEQTGTDRTDDLTVGLSWTPTRALQFGCSVGEERRSGANGVSVDFSDRHYSCFGQFTLQ